MGHPRIILRPTSILRKQIGQMRKLLGRWDQTKKPGNNRIIEGSYAVSKSQVTDGRPVFLVAAKGITQSHITRRQIVLNRHFTEIISDVLANNLKRQLTDIGVNITSIETKAWNKGVNVFYYTNKPFEMKTHQALNSLVTELRAAITERRLIGRTPLINFVYDQAAETEQGLNEALKLVKISDPEDNKSLIETPSKDIKLSKGFERKNSGVVPNRFSAPDGMCNKMLGLDYPSLYDEVIAKLERGRAQAARMPSNVSLASTAPFIRVPNEDSEELDPESRVLSMQKFLVSQRKKNEYLSKVRRKQELLARDSYKWDVPKEEMEECECEPELDLEHQEQEFK